MVIPEYYEIKEALKCKKKKVLTVHQSKSHSRVLKFEKNKAILLTTIYLLAVKNWILNIMKWKGFKVHFQKEEKVLNVHQSKITQEFWILMCNTCVILVFSLLLFWGSWTLREQSYTLARKLLAVKKTQR